MAVATERELVESTIYDDFVSSFSEAANRLKVGTRSRPRRRSAR